MSFTRRQFHQLSLSTIAALPAASLAQAYPSRRISIVVGAGPGGGADLVARLFAQKLSERLGQPVTVDNKPGASAALAVSFVMGTPPDGHTILLSGSSPLVIRPHVVKAVPYDSTRDLTPVAKLASWPLVLVTSATVPATNATELVTWLKAQKGKVNYASNGIGGGYQLATELFKTRTVVDMTHIPYNAGDGAMLQSLLSGETQIAFIALFTALPHIKSGSLKAYGVTAPQRALLAPQIPPLSDLLPGFVMMPWYGIFLPARAQTSVVQRLNAETNSILGDPDFGKRLGELGTALDGGTPERLADLVKSDLKLYGDIVKSANIPQE